MASSIDRDYGRLLQEDQGVRMMKVIGCDESLRLTIADDMGGEMTYNISKGGGSFTES